LFGVAARKQKRVTAILRLHERIERVLQLVVAKFAAARQGHQLRRLSHIARARALPLAQDQGLVVPAVAPRREHWTFRQLHLLRGGLGLRSAQLQEKRPMVHLVDEQQLLVERDLLVEKGHRLGELMVAAAARYSKRANCDRKLHPDKRSSHG